MQILRLDVYGSLLPPQKSLTDNRAWGISEARTVLRLEEDSEGFVDLQQVITCLVVECEVLAETTTEQAEWREAIVDVVREHHVFQEWQGAAYTAYMAADDDEATEDALDSAVADFTVSVETYDLVAAGALGSQMTVYGVSRKPQKWRNAWDKAPRVLRRNIVRSMGLSARGAEFPTIRSTFWLSPWSLM